MPAARWTRTPIGALGHNAYAMVYGGEMVDSLASFRTGVSADLGYALEQALVQGPLSHRPAAAVPTTWSPAIRAAVAARLGDDALATLDAAAAADPDADPAHLLEVHAVGEVLVSRAIERARSAGEASPESLSVHRRFLPADEARAAEKGVDDVLAMSTALDLAWPVDIDVRISSPFGYRHHPVLSKRKFHEGVDLAIPIGTPVHAAGAGKVIERARRRHQRQLRQAGPRLWRDQRLLPRQPHAGAEGRPGPAGRPRHGLWQHGTLHRPPPALRSSHQGTRHRPRALSVSAAAHRRAAADPAAD